jgi:hypothetical protein
MIVSVTTMEDGKRVCEVTELAGIKTMERLNRILQLVAAAYSDDSGTSDLDDEQPVSSVTGLNLGDVRLARRLTR